MDTASRVTAETPDADARLRRKRLHRRRRRLERNAKATGLAGVVVLIAWVFAAAVFDRRSVVVFLAFQALFVLTAVLFTGAAAIQKVSERQDPPPALLPVPIDGDRADATGFLPFADPPVPLAPYAVPAAMGAAFTVVMVLRLTTPKAADDWSGLTAVVAILLLAGVAAGSGVLLRQVQLVLRARRRHEAGITLAADHLAIHDNLSFRQTAYLTQEMVARVLRPNPGARLAPRSTTLGPPHATPNVCMELTGPVYFPAATGVPQFGTDLNAPPPAANRAGRRLYFCLAEEDDIGRLQQWLEG